MSAQVDGYAVPILVAAAVAALLYAALCDIATRQIPNWISLLILGLGVLLRLADRQILLSLGAAGVLFAFAVTLWRFGLLGGGDVKLMAATSTIIPFPQAIHFLPMVALSGGVLAVVYLLLQKSAAAGKTTANSPAGPLAARLEPRGSLPYGTAIAAGAFFSLAWH